MKSLITVLIVSGVLFCASIPIGLIMGSKAKEAKIKMLNKKGNKARIESNKPLILTIMKIEYRNELTKVPEYHEEKKSSGLLSSSHALAHSNETLTVESKLILKGRLENGKIVSVAIIDQGEIQKESLPILLKKGSRISFPKGNIKTWNTRNKYGNIPDEPILITYNETYFTEETQFGTKCASRIKIIE